MEIHAIIYLLEDYWGNKETAIVSQSSDSILVPLLRNRSGERAFFEAEAYHLESWCKENAIDLKVVPLRYDFDELWFGK